MNDQDEIRKVLKTVLWGSVFLALAIVVFFQTDVLTQGTMAGRTNAEFVVLTTAELSALALIPFAVGMFRIKSIRKKAQENYLPWAVMRLGILAFIMIANAIAYHLFANVAFGYLAIIACLCMLVVFPTRERCDSEMGKEDSGKS